MTKYAAFLEAVGKLPDSPTDDQMLACFRAAPRETIDLVAKEAPPDPLAAFADNPVIRKLIEDNRARDAKDAARDRADALREVVAFADPHAARLLFNDEQTAVLRSLLFHAGEVDRKAEKPLVTFADETGAEKSVSLVDSIKAIVAAIPDNPLARQVIANKGSLPAEFSVLKLAGADKAADKINSPEHILASSEAGKKVLADKAKKGA